MGNIKQSSISGRRPKNKVYTERVELRCTPEEKAVIFQVAQADGISVNAWVLKAALSVAKRVAIAP